MTGSHASLAPSAGRVRRFAVRLRPTTLLVVAAACGWSGGDDGSPAVHVDRLPLFSFEEEIRIGSREDPDVGFSRVGDVAVADDGTLYVADTQAMEIRVYDGDGRRLRTIGGPGEGPGEFALLSALGLVGDTLWVNDGRNRRISWFGPEGSLVHETPATTLPVATDIPGMSLAVLPARPGPDGYLMSRARRTMSGGAADRPYAVPVVRFDRDGAVVDTVRWDTLEAGPTVRVGGRALHPPALLPRNPLVVEDGEERIEHRWVVPPSGGAGVLHVVRRTAGGDTLDRSALRYDPVPLPDHVRDSLLERPEGMGRFYGVSDAELRAAMASGLELPEHRPPVRQARPGRDGSVWIELNGSAADSTDWILLDPELTPWGRVTLPAGMTLRHIDGVTAWAVETDPLDVPWLARLRLR